ncbi:MAG TPA: hypothetical protein ENJ56_07105 [Anaerolineae bacterium]|nr:hypothetical protein [Anaerolineae bacterium]
MDIIRFFVLLTTLTLLAACGSGGGATSPAEAPVSAQSSSIFAAKLVTHSSECPAGGVTIDSGIDSNGNGQLDAQEVDQQQILCNGEDGSDGFGSLLASSDIPAGSTCSSGGIQLDSGIDINANGILDDNEVQQTSSLCNGTDGQDGATGATGSVGATGSTGPTGAPGADGSDGINSLIALNPEPAGTNCPNGGVRIDAGGDNNRNNVLDSIEIDSTRFLCGAAAPLATDIIYTANPRLNELTELFAGNTDGSGSTLLFTPLQEYTDLTNFQISPDHKKLAFLAYLQPGNVAKRHHALFVADLDTLATPIQVSHDPIDPTAEAFDVSDYAWSPDSSLLVGIGSQYGENFNNYFRVFSNGSGLKGFNAVSTQVGDADPTAIDLWVGRPVFSPDGQHLALRLEDSVTLRHALIVIDSTTLNYTNVSDPKVGLQYGDVFDFAWAPDGSRIAYLARATINSLSLPEIYTVNPDGSANTQITAVADYVQSFQWAPNSSLIAMLVRTSTVAPEFELRSTTVDGSTTFTLSGSLVTGGHVSDFQWAPNSSQIAYRADQEILDKIELYAVSSVGVGRVKVSGSMIANGDVHDYAWAPDSSRIAFRADHDIDNLNELFTVIPDPLTTPVPLKVSDSITVKPPLLFSRGVIDFQWAPDSSRIAIRGDSLSAGINAMAIAAPDASFLLNASGSMAATADVNEFSWSPDSLKLAFIGDLNIDSTNELFVVDANGSNRMTISTPLPAGATTDLFLFR